MRSTLLVAWRSKARSASSRSMPVPLSETWMSRLPPARISTRMEVLPASTAFSINSLTNRCGTFNDFACGDLIGNICGKYFNLRHIFIVDWVIRSDFFRFPKPMRHSLTAYATCVNLFPDCTINRVHNSRTYEILCPGAFGFRKFAGFMLSVTDPVRLETRTYRSWGGKIGQKNRELNSPDLNPTPYLFSVLV